MQETDTTLAAAIERIRAISEEAATRIVPESVEAWGRYEGELLVRMLDDGRICELLSEYAYLRFDGSRWSAAAGLRVDGASIPQAFWSVIGGPFEGKYRNASVIHDVYCDGHQRHWRDTHRMFYEAMRCSGVGAARAKIMYYAVYRFGPRWPDPGVPVPESVDKRVAAGPTDLDAPGLVADADEILERDLSLEAIEELADARGAPR